MSIAIIGGMDRLKNLYERQVKDMGYKVKFFGRKVPNLGKRISRVDGIVILTGMVAHHMVAEVNRIARLRSIPDSPHSHHQRDGIEKSSFGIQAVIDGDENLDPT